MIEINENDLTIEAKETLSFEHSVQTVYDDIKDDVEYNVEDNAEEYSDEEIKSMKEFLAHELTKEDKIEILERIKEDYEYELYRSDCQVSLFDEDGIKKGVCDWIFDNFDFAV